MNFALYLFLGLSIFQILLVLARFRFLFALNPGGYPLLAIYLNHQVNDDLTIYFGYMFCDTIRWGLTKASGRTEFQILLTFIDNSDPEPETPINGTT